MAGQGIGDYYVDIVIASTRREVCLPSSIR